MSRVLTLGNGSILVGLDEFGQVRDFYFPYVGLENHVGGHFVHRVGVFADGRLSWTSDAGWQIKIECEKDSLVGLIEATNESLGVSLFFSDLVYNEKDIFLRRVVVRNLTEREREIKLFFAQQFEPYESHMAHTAYFDPKRHGIIHYRNQRVFFVNAQIGGKEFVDYSTGVFGSPGQEGTHLDAADGELSKNPIEHGQADSVIGLSASYGPNGEQSIYYWITVATSIAEAARLNSYVISHGPGHLQETTERFWQAWVHRQKFSFHSLPEAAVDLFNRSLLFIRAHTDNRGAIIASSDSAIRQKGKDTYTYVWPRDAAFAALALARAGDHALAQRFFNFCNNVLSGEGYLMHKYSPDGSLGSSWHPWIKNGEYRLPIQEDETAIVICVLLRYYEISKDLEFVESVYNSLIKKAADFMVLYRDEATGLPKPSYDLWEEKFDVSTYTASVVYAALIAAGQFANILGKVKSEQIYRKAAGEIKEGILQHLYDPAEKCFYKGLHFVEGKAVSDKTLDVSSVYGVYAFGVLEPSDPMVVQAIQSVEERLSCARDGGIGGIARYENDQFYCSDPTFPGNPWLVTTLWLAQYYIKLAKKEADLEKAREWLNWVTKHALSSGVLPEQLHPKTGESLSAAPLVWSHAEFVNTVIQYLDKLEELGVCRACNPVY